MIPGVNMFFLPCVIVDVIQMKVLMDAGDTRPLVSVRCVRPSICEVETRQKSRAARAIPIAMQASDHPALTAS